MVPESSRPDTPDGPTRVSPRASQIAGRISYVGSAQYDDRSSGWVSALFIVVVFALISTLAKVLLTTYLAVLVLVLLAFVFLQWITRGLFTRILGGAGRFALFFRMGSSRREQPVIPIQPFRLLAEDGPEVQCLISGRLDGGSLALGDEVVVSGRFDRARHVYRVSSVRNSSTGAVTSSRLPIGDRANRIAMWIFVPAMVWAVFAAIQMLRVFR